MPILFPSLCLVLTGKSTRDGFASSPLTAPTAQGREERSLLFSPQKMPPTPHCCFRGQPSPHPCRRAVLPGAGPHCLLAVPSSSGPDRRGGAPPHLSSPSSLSSSSQPRQAADRCTGRPWLELEFIKPTGRELFPHPSGLLLSVRGRRGLARQEEHRPDLRGWWEGILRLSKDRPHTPLRPTFSSRCISHSSHFRPPGCRRFHTSSPLHTLFPLPGMLSQPGQPVEFLLIFQIQMETSSSVTP